MPMQRLILATALPLYLWSCAMWAQQHLGNSVYVCDGLVQAGPCPAGSDEPEEGRAKRERSSGYTDNDYINGMRIVGYRRQWGAVSVGQLNSPAYIFGTNTPKDTPEEARAVALRQCEYTAAGRTTCRIAETFADACGSIAIHKNGDAPGDRFIAIAPIKGHPGRGGIEEEARVVEAARVLSRSTAVELCERTQGSGQCKMRETVCTPAIAEYR